MELLERACLGAEAAAAAARRRMKQLGMTAVPSKTGVSPRTAAARQAARTRIGVSAWVPARPI
jgi:hypothetical protein